MCKQKEENHFWGLMLTLKMNYHLHCIKSSTQPATLSPIESIRTKPKPRNNINDHIQSVRKPQQRARKKNVSFFLIRCTEMNGIGVRKWA